MAYGRPRKFDPGICIIRKIKRKAPETGIGTVPKAFLGEDKYFVSSVKV